MTSACRISNLHVAFGKTEILHGASLEAPARGVTMLTGRSGSGKTTLLRALNRLNETFPGCRTTGSVEIDLGRGMEDIYGGGRPVSELRRLVGMVFQTPNVLPVSVYRNIAIPLEAVRGMPKREIPAAAEKALRSTGLWEEVRDRLDTDAAHLSGGQQQRLCLARALALEPAVLLLDEPTSSLDVAAAAGIEELIMKLGESYPVIAVSHNPEQAVRLADRIFMVKDGRTERSFARGEAAPEDLAALLEGKAPEKR